MKTSVYSPEQLGDIHPEDFPEIPSNIPPLHSGVASFIFNLLAYAFAKSGAMVDSPTPAITHFCRKSQGNDGPVK